MKRTPLPPGRLSGVIGLTIGLAIALAANLTYTWPHGNVMIGTGVVAPLVLPIVLWIRSSFQVTHWADRLVRDGSVIAVAGPAAALSYQHTFALMTGVGVATWLAALLPLSTDGIAAISTLALHRSRRPKVPARAAKVAAPKGETVPETPPARAVTQPPANEVAARAGQRATYVEWIQRQGTFPSIKDVQAKFRVSMSTAKRARNDARQMVAS